MRRRILGAVAVAAGGAVLTAPLWAPVEWGSNGILHPWHRAVTVVPDLPYQDLTVRAEDGVALRCWVFPVAEPRGTIAYLHGITDTRASSIGIARRFTAQGYRVLACDSRAHGDSGGAVCTYGYREKTDLSLALTAAGADRAIAMGVSLGGAVALQAAAGDPRLAGVIAISSYSDLESVVRDRAPWGFGGTYATRALERAGADGGFPPAEASPRAAAPRIAVPVLLLHGAGDRKTPPAHSQRIADALRGPHRLLLVPSGHDDVLGAPGVWDAIDAFVRDAFVTR